MKFNILIDNILQNALDVILSSERQLGSKDIATMSGILTVQWHFDRLSDQHFGRTAVGRGQDRHFDKLNDRRERIREVL